MNEIQIRITRANGKVVIAAPFSESNNAKFRTRDGKWDGGLRKWVFADTPGTAKMIGELWGSSEETVSVRIPYNGPWQNGLLKHEGSQVMLGGYVIADRRNRDSAVDFPAGVTLYEGAFRHSGGSRANPRVGEPTEPVVFEVCLRKDFAEALSLEVLEQGGGAK